MGQVSRQGAWDQGRFPISHWRPMSESVQADPAQLPLPWQSVWQPQTQQWLVASPLPAHGAASHAPATVTVTSLKPGVTAKSAPVQSPSTVAATVQAAPAQLPSTAMLPGARSRWQPLAERTMAPPTMFARLALRLRELEDGTHQFSLPAIERGREKRLLDGWYYDLGNQRFLFVDEDAVDDVDEALTFWAEGNDSYCCLLVDGDGVAWTGKTNSDLIAIKWTRARSEERNSWVRLSHGRL